MSYFPPSIQNLIDQFNKLPGIGPKTAEKLVFYLLKQSRSELNNFAQALEQVKEKTLTCESCQNFSETSPCSLCSNQKRDQTTLCVVAEPQDLMAIESTGEYHGSYQILGGTINTLEGITPDQLKIKELLNRLIQPRTQRLKEIILGFNPDLEGETTMLYLKKILQPYKIKITRLARGLPMGSDLEYADEVTLANALKGRREI